VFEVLFGEEDAIVSDELNHASIIDGIRLSKAMPATATATPTWPTCGPSSRPLAPPGPPGRRRHRRGLLDGRLLRAAASICDLAEEYAAMVLVDDSHAVGFVGDGGRGTPELFGVADRVDIITGTLGKALGGASGGYVSAHQEIVDLLRQRSRPYLFSNSVAPAVVAGSLAALALVSGSGEARKTLQHNTALFRQLMTDAGFELVATGDLPDGVPPHPITPVMFPGEDGARLAGRIADHMLGQGVYVIPFSYPVVPKGKARIRVQLSAAHSEDDVRACVAAFVAARAAVAQGG
jgi:glycine C-acetyltransferase